MPPVPGPLQAPPLPLVAAFGVVGLVLIALGVREAVGALRTRTGRPTPVGDLTAGAGRAVVSGVARRAEGTVEAPLSGRPTLAYSWRETEHRSQVGFDGDIDTWGQAGVSGRGAVPFLLEDHTGRVLVVPDGASLRLREEWIRDPVTVPDARGADSSIRDVAEELLRIETYGRRYYESRLEEGETVTVRGRVVSDEGRPDDRRRDRGVVVEADLVADSTPAGAAGRSLRGAAVSVAAGLFVLLVVGVFLLISLA